MSLKIQISINMNSLSFNLCHRSKKSQGKFKCQEIKDIEKTVRKAKRENLIPVIRLNGTSDISWENLKVKDDKNIFELFPEVNCILVLF